jgi:hypothetical protein
LSSTSCQKSDKEIESHFLESAIEAADTENKYNWLVILPGLGCTGCIQEAEAFMQENVENREILFVLTKIQSLKILEKKIELKIENHPNILVDRSNSFVVPTRHNIYPCIIQLENGKLKMHGFQSPETSQAFEKLRNQIEYN